MAGVISHHGIKGQKWGVRRARGSDGTVSSAHPSSSDAAKATELHNRVKSAGGTHTLSNPELQHLVNRMNLEQSFSRLSSSQKNAGQKLAEEILVSAGKQHLTSLLVGGMKSLTGN
jgi:hypothetical protein